MDVGLKPRFLIFTLRLSRLISITIINNRGIVVLERVKVRCTEVRWLV